MKVLSATGLVDEKGVDVFVCAREHVCVCVHGVCACMGLPKRTRDISTVCTLVVHV